MATNRETTESPKKSTQPAPRMNRPSAKWKAVESSLEEVKGAFGFVPTFVNNLTDQGIPGSWNEAKHLRFSSHTALELKLKGLIGLGVAAQIPCDLVTYFDQKATAADGATRQEQLEAVEMAAITRHWSTVLNGAQLDKAEFRKEADQVITFVKKMMEDLKGQMPPEDLFLYKPATAQEAYKDIEKTLGLIPKFFLLFPEYGIAGAWSEFKAIQLNPYTALSGKQKELIGLAVAAQIPCDYCIYFHRGAAVLNGANDQELQEAISLAAFTRHWSTVFHGPEIDHKTYRQDVDRMIEESSRRRLQS